MHKLDQMTPLERAEAIAQGKPYDRIRIVPQAGITFAPYCGVTPREYIHSAEAMVRVETEMYRRLGHDGAGISITLRGLAEAMGSVMNYPEHDISLLERTAVETEEDIDRLKVINPMKDGKLPLVMEALERLHEQVGHEVRVSCGITGPFSVCASVVGTERLLRWIVKKPEAIHRVMRLITDSNQEIIKAAAARGFACTFSDPVSSSSLLKRNHFLEFSLPYLKENIDQVKRYAGINASVHMCGKSKDFWNDLAESGMGCFSLDNIEDLAEAKAAIGDRVCLTGNVPPVEVMRFGTPDMVRQSVKECIKKGFGSPKGYILGTGCQISLGTPLENVEAFMAAGREFGAYPVCVDEL